MTYQMTRTLFVLILLVLSGTSQSQVFVVDMVAREQSDEHDQDAEPNLAVNPANPLLIAASAFTRPPDRGPNAPIYTSQDGGRTWALNTIVPGNSSLFNPTNDITLQFNGSGSQLYISILRGDILKANTLFGRLNIIRIDDFLAGTPGVPFFEEDLHDQPHIQATTTMRASEGGADRVYVGSNRMRGAGTNQTAILHFSTDAAAQPPPIDAETIEARTFQDQDGPAIMPAIHASGKVYAVFYRLIHIDPETGTAQSDVVLVRDDDWGNDKFQDLSGDGVTAGLIINQTPITVPVLPMLGQNRLSGSNLSIAVDPNDASTVYVSWADTDGSRNTLHVQKSTNGGLSWSGDLATIHDAINPALAVNIAGKVGFLYQELTNSDAQWETHLQTSAGGNSTWEEDILLCATPADSPRPDEQPYLGDYEHLMSVGKDFYGVFSASNDPRGNFPNGIVLNREHEGRQLFTDATHTSIVQTSIDPFFFHVTEMDPSEDFFVRDFTNSPFEYDRGVEPSVDRHFVTRSDLWNRRSADPGTFNFLDQPDCEDPWQSIDGLNYGFVRVHRKQDGPTRKVELQYLYSDFGSGNNFMAALPPTFNPLTFLTPIVQFDPGETAKISKPYVWALPATSSDHVCLAVQISTDQDPVIQPGLYWQAPGWSSGTDLMIVNDNNKAQRNMDVFRLLWPLFPLPPNDSSDQTSNGAMSYYAVIHNPGLNTQDLQFEIESGSRSKFLPSIEVMSGQEKHSASDSGNLITLYRMLPGESRVVRIGYVLHPEERTEKGLHLIFDQVKNEVVINGFGVTQEFSSVGKVADQNLRYDALVCQRTRALYEDIGIATSIRQTALKSLRDSLSSNRYFQYLVSSRSMRRSLVGKLVRLTGADPFGLNVALTTLDRQLERSDTARAANAHLSLLNSIDAYLTSLQLAKGNPADILQTIRLQREILSKISSGAGKDSVKNLLDMSGDFISDYQNQKISNSDYPNRVKNMLPKLRTLAITMAANTKHGEQVMNLLKRMEEKINDPTELQGAHMQLLLLLQETTGD